MIRLVRKFNIEHYLSSRIVLIIDLVVSLMASATTLMLMHIMFKPYIMPHPSRFTMQWLCVAFVASLILFYVLKTYRSVIRHATLREIGHLTLATLGKETALCTLLVVHPDSTIWDVQNTAILVFDTLITLCMLILVRVAMVVAYDMIKSRIQGRRGKRHILIYGTESNSVAMAQQLQNSKDYSVVGFLTYGPRLKNHTINDARVYYFIDQESLILLREKLDIDAVLLTSAAAAHSEQNRLIRYATKLGLKVLITPPIDEFQTNATHRKVREINIEDLLMRPEIKISMEAIRADFKGKCVMVTGAAGSIGSELCRQMASLEIDHLVMFDNAETPMHNLRLEFEEHYPNVRFTPVIGDVRSTARLDHTFKAYSPNIVFHAAAYKHVPLMEENPCEAVYVNLAGSRNVADKCLEYGVEKMVMISTDKAVNPTNIMGATKRLAEIYVQSLGLAVAQGEIEGKTKFVTTRFGNVLGSNGSVIPRFREQIIKGGPVTVTHPDITRFFMTIPEACRLVMEAAQMSQGNEIFVFDMGESVRIADMARHMIELAGYIPDEEIKIEYTGLRPGEKLYEEVLANDENTRPTSHGRIRIAEVRKIDYSEARNIADSLETMARDVVISEMVCLMKSSVPEYKSANSVFERFDRA